ncbi:hypothetical protein BDZ90DRAFT_246039 [Jaminaea rosea]|uniref:Uncharacterized protein n=1 Tax=Jaminaea rosea TaxID=1569628 RepID=A0A316US60_9BASI|nr:hypothetical protein BDZ90DRAFT_246039 [Jaminaea rosea]PWN28122.1 hypothetical protein BDZ90DRAFT_246039 [Jaminaea rosea]
MAGESSSAWSTANNSMESTPGADDSNDAELLASARALDQGDEAPENGNEEQSNGGDKNGGSSAAGPSTSNGRGRPKMTDEQKLEAQRRKQQQKEEEEDSEEHQKRAQKLKFLLQRSGVYSKIMSDKMERERKSRAEAAAKKAAKEEGGTEGSGSAAKSAPVGRTTRAGEAEDKPQANGHDDGAPQKKSVVNKRKPKEGDIEISDYLTKDDLQSKKQKSNRGTPVPASQQQPHRSRQPALVTGAEMRDYQLDGFEWLVSLYENGLNGILADEMGLGKTLQTIAFLAHLRSKGVWGPFLIVAPLSTIANWVNEFERFTPGIPALMYHAQDKKARASLRRHLHYPSTSEEKKAFPVVVTSFEVAMMDRVHLSHLKWKYIVVDEGHRLKNMNCKLIQELKRFSSAQRLILTGTPLHNNLKELWSLLNFILPDIFDDLETFEKWFDFSDIHNEGGSNRLLSKEDSKSVITQLHAILKPFLLRRIKTDVETTLPPKKEYLLYAPLSPLQKELYDRCVHGNVRRWLLERKTGLKWEEIKKILGNEPESEGEDENDEAEGSSSASWTESKAKTNGKSSAAAASSSSGPTSSAMSRRRKGRTSKINYAEEDEDVFAKRIERGEDVGRDPTPEPPSFKEQERQGKLFSIRQAQREINNMKLQNLFMQLRKICCHPYLFDWPREPDGQQLIDKSLVTASGKMLLLNRLLDALFAKKHKVLIFSQFTTILDIIQDWAEEYKNFKTCRIDGTTAQEVRRAQMKSFNEDSSEDSVKLFLLSTRAGGLGINLVAADTVIFYDSDWNPQMDLQAQDRVHRIGQKKPVLIFRLVSANTVESRLLKRAGDKRKLEAIVIKNGAFKLPAGAVSDALSGGSKSGGGSGKNESMVDMARSLLALEGEKVQLAGEDDEVISQKTLDLLLDRSEAAYARGMGWSAQGASGSDPAFEVTETAADGANEDLARLMADA